MNVTGITDKIEKHAELIGVLASVWSRNKESTLGGGTKTGIMGYFTDWDPNGTGIANILKNDTDLNYLQNKLLNTSHLYSLLIKVGGGLWVAGELDLPFVGKYKSLGWKLLKAGVEAGLILPGSGPENAGRSNAYDVPFGRRSTTLQNPSLQMQNVGAY
jgi:hypothetical protein